MIDIEEFKSEIIDKVKSRFIVNQSSINFQKQFYYPKLIHLLKFNIEKYEVKELGNMAILQGRGFGLMKMITVVFTPSFKKDIPLVIIDFIKMANKRTVFIEFYSNHIVEKNHTIALDSRLKKIHKKYSNIENYIENPNWYTPLRNEFSPLKKGTKNDDSLLCQMVLESLDAYLDCVSEDESEMDIKNKQLECFINDLINKGNPSTSVLEKALGKEETRRFFEDVVFYYDGR